MDSRTDAPGPEAAIAAEREIARLADELARQAFGDTLLDTIDMGIVACDADGRLTVFNRVTRHWHGLDADAGLDPDQWAGNYSLYDADGETPLSPDRVPLARALRDGSVHHAQIVIAPTGRAPMRALCSGRQLHAADGSVIGAVVAMHDITQLHATTTALRDAVDELAREKQFRDVVLDTVDAGILACDANGTIVLRNKAHRRITGVGDDESVTPDDVASRILVLDADGREVPPMQSPLRRALAGEDLRDMGMRIGRASSTGSDEMHDLVVNARRVYTVDGTLIGAVAALTDVTAERRVQAQLRESAAFHDAVLAATPDIIFVSDVATQAVVWSSGTITDSLGYTTGELRAMGRELIATIVHPDDVALIRDANETVRTLADGEAVATRYRVRRSDGSWRWYSRRATPFSRDSASTVTQFLAIARDVTDTVAMEEQLADAALHDPLTGLPNRRLLTDRLGTALARCSRTQSRVAVLFCDLDGFKNVNDTAGHAAGDVVLTTTAERLRTVLRPEDTIARVGGDEFVVVVEPSNDPALDWPAAVTAVVDRIRSAIAVPVAIDGADHIVTVSIGVTFAGAGDDPEDTLRDADTAMYHAKTAGKNRHELFDVRLRDTAANRRRVEQILRSALRGSGEATLTVAYQPIVDFGTARIVGVEALARLTDSAAEAVSPAMFIPVAEETGLIAPLGRLVLETACRDMSRWHAENSGWRHLGLSVNLSARQVGLRDLTEQVLATLESTGLAPHLLTLELTETVLMDAGPAALETLRELRRLGVQISIDDFGTGYASLRYLTQLPVTGVKVDRSFTAGLPLDATSTTIVRAVTGLARDLGLSCVVEGIETDSQRMALPEGVLGQGYLLGRPMNENSMSEFLRARGDGAHLAYCTGSTSTSEIDVAPDGRA